MMEINKEQQEKLENLTDEMISKIKSITQQLEDLDKQLEDFCNTENIDTYYTWTIGERLNQAKLRADQAKIRIEEFKREVKNGRLSTGGFF